MLSKTGLGLCAALVDNTHVCLLIVFCIFVRLKKAASIFLLLISVLAYTEFGQLLKLPVLIAHYQEHNAGYHKLKIWDYIRDHYNNNDNVPADHERDMQLPFKTNHTCQANLILHIPAQPVQISEPFNEMVLNFPRVDDGAPCHVFTGSVFQPPRA